MAERMGMLSGTEVIIYCMEIEHMEVSDSLSYSVKKGLPHLVKAVYDEVIAYMGKSVLEKVKMK
jgi:hypothetical protein